MTPFIRDIQNNQIHRDRKKGDGCWGLVKREN